MHANSFSAGKSTAKKKKLKIGRSSQTLNEKQSHYLMNKHRQPSNMVEKDSREEEQCWHVQTVNGENSSVITNSLQQLS